MIYLLNPCWLLTTRFLHVQKHVSIGFTQWIFQGLRCGWSPCCFLDCPFGLLEDGCNLCLSLILENSSDLHDLSKMINSLITTSASSPASLDADHLVSETKAIPVLIFIHSCWSSAFLNLNSELRYLGEHANEDWVKGVTKYFCPSEVCYHILHCTYLFYMSEVRQGGSQHKQYWSRSKPPPIIMAVFGNNTCRHTCKADSSVYLAES